VAASLCCGPAGGALQGKQLYFADTNVLVSRQLG